VTIAVLGVMHIVDHPAVIWNMLNPWNAVASSSISLRAFIAMGSVVLAVTGAEALYADMGHFGRKPDQGVVALFRLPALLLNYMGQGAMLLSQSPARRSNGQESVLLSSRPKCFACRWCCSPPRRRSSPARR
jgi:KUP system potassium uptake protein